MKEVLLVTGNEGVIILYIRAKSASRIPNFMKKRLLVVEDEEPLRILYREELETEGYEVLTAQNGKEALQELEKGRP